MNKSQILALMMRRNQQTTQTDLLSISSLFAETLADIADRLSEDEFYRFIGIGSAVYNHGLEQFGEDEEEDVPSLSDEDRPDQGAGRYRGRH